MIEVIPIQDTEQHAYNGRCKCNPDIEINSISGEVIIVHMAFDGRHLIEQVNDILNNPQLPNRWMVVKT